MMAPPLSRETQRRLDALFAASDRLEAERLLVEQCGNNLPFDENLDAVQLERVRFAALKLSEGNLGSLRDAVELAQIDSRDLLMAAGFGEDTRAHERWFPDDHAA
jgi:hypothetical protein